MDQIVAGLPALLVVGLGSALVGVAKMLGEPLPKRFVVWAAGLTLFLFWPVLVGGRVLLSADLLRGFVPFQLLPPVVPHGNFLQRDLVTMVAPALAGVRERLLAGEWPLVDLAVGSGAALWSDPQAQAAFPLAWLALLVPFDAALGVLAASRVLLALLGGFLLWRRIGLSPLAASFSSTVYGLGGFVQLWLGWPLANIAALLPWLAWATLRAAERRTPRPSGVLTLLAAGVLVAGHPEAGLHAGLFCAGLAFWRATSLPDSLRSVGVRSLATSWLLAFFLTAPAVLPAIKHLAVSERSAQLVARAARAAPGVAAPGDGGLRLVPVVAPHAFGNDRYLAYWGATNINEDASGWTGTPALLLAVLALSTPVATWRRRERLFVGSVLAGCLVVIARPSGLGELMVSLPLPLQSSAQHQRLLLLVTLCVAWLAGRALDGWLRSDRGASPRWRAFRGSRSWPHVLRPTAPDLRVLVGALVLTAVLAWAYSTHSPPDGEGLQGYRLGWLARHLKFLALAAGGGLVMARLGGSGRRAVAAALVAAAGYELVLAHQPANPSQPRSGVYPATAALSAAREILTEGPLGLRLLGLDQALPPNVATLYGLADPRIYSPATPAAYAELAVAAAARQPDELLLDRLAVGLLLSDQPPAAGSANEVVWVGEGSRLVARSGVALARWSSANRSTALAGSPTPPRILSVEPAVLSIGLEEGKSPGLATAARTLEIAVAAAPGWRALDDGRPVSLYPDRGLLAMDVAPSSSRVIRLIYRPPGLLTGVAFAALGWSVLIACGLTRPAQSRSNGR